MRKISVIIDLFYLIIYQNKRTKKIITIKIEIFQNCIFHEIFKH